MADADLKTEACTMRCIMLQITNTTTQTSAIFTTFSKELNVIHDSANVLFWFQFSVLKIFHRNKKSVCSHSPVPSINWRRVDGVPFSRKVDTRKASGVLEIPYFQQEDAGTYECVAENSRGMNTVKGKLSFYGRWSWCAWIFDQHTPHLSAPLRLRCIHQQTQAAL